MGTDHELLGIDPEELTRLRAGHHGNPHGILGAHPGQADGSVVLRAFHPDATACHCLREGREAVALEALGEGLFAALVPDASLPLAYRLRFEFPGGGVWERDDPYRFLPTAGEMDQYLIGEGSHRRLWEVLGARVRELDGTAGVSFAVWAPNAAGVSVIGAFCGWDGRLLPMRALGATGVFELFVPGIGAGTFYKFEIRTAEGTLRVKADPLARAMELPPGTASVVVPPDEYRWNDTEWQARRASRDVTREPMAVYEVHLGSWARVPEEGGRSLSYRELAPRLVEHMKRYGFNYLELLPVAEHPYYPSWGYQVSAYYAPTSRYGSPDDLRYLIDLCHQNGIGVILDWVPAHFPKDDFALARFDGTALYEHADARKGEHPDWGTLIFNFGRHEVRNFLIANALYWLEVFHVDGLRVDAVASLLYLDYSRAEGQWVPNEHGGRENLEAVRFLEELNTVIAAEQPGSFTVAEESTSWGGVTRPVSEGGLGFTFKWNMGWMHDTLAYFRRDPVHRKFHQDQLTFAMIYEYSERFVMPLSHDEVVHGKGSLLNKMPGDPWQQLANLRLLYSYLYTRPGKKLLFMGSELAPWREWNHEQSLDWHLLEQPERRGFARCLQDLGRLYLAEPCLWRRDHEPDGFRWIDCADREQSILSYVRRDGDDLLVVVLNLTPAPRHGYWIGAPRPGRYRLLFNSDAWEYGGSLVDVPAELETEPRHVHSQHQALRLELPPLSALILRPE